MNIFYLPDLGEGLPNVIIRQWHVRVGDVVSQHQTLVSVETAKAFVDIPAPHSGTIGQLFGLIGETMDTGSPLIEWIGDHASSDAQAVVGTLEQSDALIAHSTDRIACPQSTHHNIRIAPALRQLAKNLNVDLNTIQASGPVITRADIEAAASQKNDVTWVSLTPARRAMAITLEKAHQSVAAATLMDEANLSAWSSGQDTTVRLLRAMAAACAAVPLLYARYDEIHYRYQLNTLIHIGLAIDTPHGLYAPVVRDVINQSDEAIRTTIQHFKNATRQHTLTQGESEGANIMMSNIGAISGTYAIPMLIPPLVSIVAFGRIHKQMRVNDQGEAIICPIIPISLTFDHRPATGGDAARFLKILITHLEKEK